MATNFSLAISDLIFGVLVVCHQKHNKLAKRIEKGLKTRKRLPKRAESLWVSVSPSVQKFPALMACNGSLPCSQQPVTRPFPEPDKSSPHCPISDFFQTHFFFSQSTPASSSESLHSCIPTKTLYAFVLTPVRITCPSLPLPTPFNLPNILLPIPVAARSKAWVCGRSLLGLRVRIPPAACMDDCCECCVLSGRSLRWAGHSSRGFLPSVLCLSVIKNPRQ